MNIQSFVGFSVAHSAGSAILVVGMMTLSGALLGCLTEAVLSLFGIRGAAARADEV